MSGQGQPVNVPLIGINQSVPDTSGPVGRIQRLLNAQAKKFVGQGVGARLRVEKREGFAQFSTTVRDFTTGNTSAKSMANPTAMGVLGNRLVTIAGAAAFVLSETAGCFETQPYHCPTQSLRMRNVPIQSATANPQQYTPDSARIGSRTMYTWTGFTPPPSTFGGAFKMIVDDDGTVIRQAAGIGSGTVGLVKAVADGTQFWTVEYDDIGGTYDVNVFDTNGVSLAATNTAVTVTAGTKWDVMPSPFAANQILLVQKTPALATFQIISYSYAAGVISVGTTAVGGTVTNGMVAFLRNDSGDGNLYVGAIGGAGPFDYRVYQVNNIGTVLHTYTVATTQTPAPFEFTGYVAPTGNKDITVALGFQDVGGVPAGPFTYRNFINIYTVTFAGVATLADVRRGLTPVSRPFQMNGTYYIAIYYQADTTVITPVQQSTFFLYNLGNTFQVCGRWEFGLAYADWQNLQGVNAGYHWHLSTPTVAPNGAIHLNLAYRAKSFTARVGSIAQTGIDVGAWHNTPLFAVALRDYAFGPDSGEPLEAFNELLFPGPQCSVYTGGTFTEEGIGLIPEMISATASVTVGSMTSGVTYNYVLSTEDVDDAGNVVRAPVGPPIAVTLGTAPARTAADLQWTNIHVTKRNTLKFVLGRTAFVGGQSSTAFYKVLSDFAPIYNQDGSMSISYTDTLGDAQLILNEKVYTSKGYTDRFPAPAHRGGCANADRCFVIGYDNAVWFSGPKTEGDAWWFTPAFRMPMPTSEQITKCVLLDNYLIVFCDTASIFIVPIANLPDATGIGFIPSPQLLPFSNGSTGFAVVTNDGVIYSAAQGGIWLLTRGLQNVYIGLPINDEVVAGAPIAAMEADKNQRVYTLLPNAGIGSILMYDQISDQWALWTVPTTPTVFAIHKGLFAYADSNGGVWRQSPNTYQDVNFLSVATAINQVITLAAMYFGGIRGFVRLWEAELEGIFYGVHNLIVNAAFYQDDNDAAPVNATYSFSPVANVPYVFRLPPQVEEISHVVYTFVETPATAGGTRGFALEGMGFEVAIDHKIGRVSNARTIKGV